MERNDIYRRGDQCAAEEERLQKSQISERNKDVIRRFLTRMKANGCGPFRITKLGATLRNTAIIYGKDFADIKTEEDATELFSKINSNNQVYKTFKHWKTKQMITQVRLWSYHTKKDYLKTSKRLLKWLNPDDAKLHRVLDKFKMPKGHRQIGNIITESDIQKILECDQVGIRDKAIISVLHEVGCRVGEFCNIRIGDVTKDGPDTKLRLFGKTGERKVLIYTSTPYLFAYLRQHPFRSREESFLWLTDNPRARHKPLCYTALTRILKKRFAQVGLTHLQANPHFFRHSRATLNAKFLTEPEMKGFFGWDEASSMTAVYVHLSGRDVDMAVRRMHGLETKAYENVNHPKKCPICGNLNEPIAKFCSNCGSNFDLRSAVIAREEHETMKEMVRLLSDPQNLKAFLEYKQQQQGQKV